MKRVLCIISILAMITACGTEQVQSADINITEDGVYTSNSGSWFAQRVGHIIDYIVLDNNIQTNIEYVIVSPSDSRMIRLELPTNHIYINDGLSGLYASDGAFSIEFEKGNPAEIREGGIDLVYDYNSKMYKTTGATQKVHEIYKTIDDVTIVCKCYSDAVDWTLLVDTIGSTNSFNKYTYTVINSDKFPVIDEYYTQSVFIDKVESINYFKSGQLSVVTVQDIDLDSFNHWVAGMNKSVRVVDTILDEHKGLVYSTGEYYLGYISKNKKIILCGYGEEALYNIIKILEEN